MFKFFRSIRQNLINENKTSKYFRYAFGEIVLIVVGILIAVQISDWTEKWSMTSVYPHPCWLWSFVSGAKGQEVCGHECTHGHLCDLSLIFSTLALKAILK